VAQLVKVSGGRVIGVDLKEVRLEMAQKLGAIDIAINAGQERVAEKIKALTEQRGADMCIEISGFYPALQEAIRKTDPRIAIGLMTAGASWTTYSGQAFERWFTVLGATKARPGGGCYSDAAPLEMLDKALECSLALGHGLNGIAFSMRGTPTAGLWPAWSPRLKAHKTVHPSES